MHIGITVHQCVLYKDLPPTANHDPDRLTALQAMQQLHMRRAATRSCVVQGSNERIHTKSGCLPMCLIPCTGVCPAAQYKCVVQVWEHTHHLVQPHAEFACHAFLNHRAKPAQPAQGTHLALSTSASCATAMRTMR